MEITALDPTRTAPPRGRGGERAAGQAQEEVRSGLQAAAGDRVELSQTEKARVADLKATDAAVKAHEAAHMAAGSGLVKGGASYGYTQGPDGKRYATSGEVSIDTSVPEDPQEALSKARRIRAAALAPADPSAQDRQVAAQASRMEAEAGRRLAQERAARSASGAYQAAAASPRPPDLDITA